MAFTLNGYSPRLVGAVAAGSALLLSSSTGAAPPNTSSADQIATETALLKNYCATNELSTVPTGNEKEARAYYADLTKKIGLVIVDPESETDAATTLPDLLDYLGYGARGSASRLTTAEVQNTLPAALMDPAGFGARLGLSLKAGDILSVRFFAPKISDVSGHNPDAGWRKLVRFKAQPGSRAAGHQIDSAFVLFNFFAPRTATEPLPSGTGALTSVNTQTILLSNAHEAPLYWLDFDGAGRLSHKLDAFFDAGHPIDSSAKQSYYLPCGCISCHGALQLDMKPTPPAPDTHFRSPLLDYLDTDHWADRIEGDNDFAGLPAPIILDAGGFDVIRKINAEIEQQNEASQPLSTAQRAAEHWLTLHRFTDQHIDLFTRSIDRAGGVGPWSIQKPVDAQLLPALNRFCFRCHGSVLFDVFDKTAVVKLKSSIFSRMHERAGAANPAAMMPPDRDMPEAQLKVIRDLVLQLSAQ